MLAVVAGARRPTACPDANGNDRTWLYVKKRGNPRAGKRVFIYTRRQVNGWESRGQMQKTTALVPSSGGAAGGERGGRAGAKRG